MHYYEEFQLYKQVLLLRLSTLPAAYGVKDYFSAIYLMDLDAIKNTGNPVGFISMFFQLLMLALRLPIEETGERIQIIPKDESGRTLDGVNVRLQDGNKVLLKLNDLQEIREAIAFLNGEKLPDESENPELVRAREQLAEIGSARLDANVNDLISSVAYASGLREKELLDWTIREFNSRVSAISRQLLYVICGINEGSGATWKNGNPAPSWYFDRHVSPSEAFTPVGQVLGTLGQSESWLDAQQKN